MVIVFVLALCAVSFLLARHLRQRHFEPKYIPGKYFKRKWKQWHPGSASYGQVPNQGAANGDQDTRYQGAGATNPEMTTTAGVQRETSIRSIITLPAYSPSPKPTEQVIGREGEREGMDMVVEFPETSEEQETRREDQMESLYQIRLQRRQELADREARRQERRSARARGDSVRLEELAAESRARTRRHQANSSNTSLSAATAIAEHQSRERDRRISSVSYASIGHVRHDGSRLRADSHESDHHPLLENAAVNASSPSLADRPATSLRSRNESVASSFMTTDTGGTDSDPLILAPTSTRGSSRPVSEVEEDIGTLNIQPPPEYDHLDWGDAPAYESPTRQRTEEPRQLASVLTTLPSIHVDIASPIAISPATPTESRHPESEDDHETTPRGPIRTSVVSEFESGSTSEHTPVS